MEIEKWSTVCCGYGRFSLPAYAGYCVNIKKIYNSYHVVKQILWTIPDAIVDISIDITISGNFNWKFFPNSVASKFPIACFLIKDYIWIYINSMYTK